MIGRLPFWVQLLAAVWICYVSVLAITFWKNIFDLTPLVVVLAVPPFFVGRALSGAYTPENKS